MHMGNCGEDTAATLAISRQAQDDYTRRSYTLAARAYEVSVGLQPDDYTHFVETLHCAIRCFTFCVRRKCYFNPSFHLRQEL